MLKDQNSIDNYNDFINSHEMIAAGIPYMYYKNYRALLDLDGNTCSYMRALEIMLSYAVLFKPESSKIQWWYDKLEPYVNYIPLRNDIYDIVEKVDWMRNNLDLC